MVRYVIEQKPNTCVVYSSLLSGWTPYLSLWLADYAVLLYVHQVSARSLNTAFVWRVPRCSAGFTVAVSAHHSPSAVWFYSLATMVTTGLSHAADNGNGPLKQICVERWAHSWLTAYIQPCVTCGHASFIDGRESVPASIRLHHPLYQQALSAWAVLIQTVETQRHIHMFSSSLGKHNTIILMHVEESIHNIWIKR